ncbi:MAG: bifunctional riboflavin kinase/FAD synthetase [Actinobacteria bacterium]|nr:bifunctional riboflavin kinase/FAD synthetase [Actinomycetota bacterium]
MGNWLRYVVVRARGFNQRSCWRPSANQNGRVDGRVITIGVYDGVHLGHRALIAQAHELGDRLGLETAILTFDRHPAQLVSPDRAPCILTDLDQKVELLRSTGVDHVEVLTFDEARRQESAEDFVRTVLVDRMSARAVVVGRDFHFGHGRRGNVDLLTAMGQDLGFEVHGLELVPDVRGETVSSTRVRSLLAEGDVAGAALLLGRQHEVRGHVIRGDSRARDLGAPTANIEVTPGICLPGEAIYAGWYERPAGDSHPAAISLGRRPTFYGSDGALVLEAHLLDFDGDLYGQPARLRFAARLRGQETYPDVDELRRQMAADLDAARSALLAAS